MNEEKNPEKPLTSFVDLPREAADVVGSFGKSSALLLAGQISDVLIRCARILPQRQKVIEMLNDTAHPMFTSGMNGIPPQLAQEFAKVRREHVHALVHFLGVLEKSADVLRTNVSNMSIDSNKNAVDESMRRLGIE